MIGKNSKIFVTGHKGLVGSAILRKLKFLGYKKIITIEKKNIDLRNQTKVFNFLKIKDRCCYKCSSFSWWYTCKF